MRILIIGAGAVASVMSAFLSKSTTVKEIICASRNTHKAKEFILSKSDKISLAKLDASKKSQVIKAAKNVDLIINASLPDFNERIMEAALEVGANYQDLCSHLVDLRHAEQLNFHKKFEKEKLIALINTGVSPGVTNLLAREAADKLDSVSNIRIRVVEEQKASELIFAWSPQVALDELTAQPLVYKNRRFKLTKPFGDVEEYEFPDQFGKRHVVNIYGDEISTLPLYIKTKNIDYKSCGTDIEFSKALYRLGLFDKKPIKLHGKHIVPLEFFSKIAPSVPSPKKMIKLIKQGAIENAILALVADTVGNESGRKIRIRNTAIFPDLREITKRFPGATYISYPTGISAVAFSRTLSKINRYGVFPPEALDKKSRKNILIELENNGTRINEEFTKV